MASTLSMVIAANSGTLAQTSPSGQACQKTKIEIVRSALTSKSDPQPTTATIKGIIIDQNGALAPTATVTLLSKPGSQIAKTVSGEEGQFQISSLLPGHYTMKVEAKGFAEVGIRRPVDIWEMVYSKPCISTL